MMTKDGNLANDKTTGGKGQSSSCAAIATLMETFIDVQLSSIASYAILDMAISARAAAVQGKHGLQSLKEKFCGCKCKQMSQNKCDAFFYVILRINHLCNRSSLEFLVFIQILALMLLLFSPYSLNVPNCTKNSNG